jgi:serine/threonine-protein kinase
MSTVYLARQVDMDRPVAIKVMSDEVASRDDLVEQLLVEARIAASLNHPNIVRALDAGFANGRCYFVMEFIEGETLRDRIQRDGALPAEAVQALGISLASALNELDRHHLIHRDVKPANILLGEHGAVHLVDFGLACIELELSEGDSARTVGTPQYMSPEQIVDPASVDIRSDLFSLGSTLSHALTGVCPFEAKGAGESLSRVLYETPLPLRDQGGGWPLGLCDV